MPATTSPTPEQASPPSIASVGLATVCTLLASLTVLTTPFLRRYTGAPYVASSPAARAAIRAALHERRGAHPSHAPPRFTDLGSGSGELVLDAARAGFRARGVELNLWLVLRARASAWRLPDDVRARVEFAWQDMWTCEVGDEDVVAVFGVPGIMERVGGLVEGCHEGCLVCCNSFAIPGRKAKGKRGGVYFYSVGRMAGAARKDC